MLSPFESPKAAPSEVVSTAPSGVESIPLASRTSMEEDRREFEGREVEDRSQVAFKEGQRYTGW